LSAAGLPVRRCVKQSAKPVQALMARASRGELDGVEIEDGALYIARIKAAVPEAARDLAVRPNGMLPRVRITELLRDIEGRPIETIEG
jgi:hypothetical protein